MNTEEERYTGENETCFQFNKRIVISRQDSDEPYLIRRTLLSFGKYFSIKYHQIMQSDDACSHDHPWGFLTFILKGGYYEWTPPSQNDRGKIIEERIGVDGSKEVKRWHGVGSILYRPAKWTHRLELKRPVNYYRPVANGKLMEDPIIAHTLVFTFEVIRDWGFFTKNGWIFWKNYSEHRDC